MKVSFHPSGEDEVSSATMFHEAAYTAGVPTPRVQRTTEGRVFATVGGEQVRVYEWVDLGAPDARLDPERVGAVVAGIHRASVTGGTRLDPWYHEPNGAGRWDHLVSQLREAGAPFADLRDELAALNSGPADPSQELGCVLFEFARADSGRVRALTQAYRQAGGPAAVNRRGHFSMLIAQLGHITEIAATDWLRPNPRSPERSGSAAWVSEVLDEPHTREVLDAILSASGAVLSS